MTFITVYQICYLSQFLSDVFLAKLAFYEWQIERIATIALQKIRSKRHKARRGVYMQIRHYAMHLQLPECFLCSSKRWTCVLPRSTQIFVGLPFPRVFRCLSTFDIRCEVAWYHNRTITKAKRSEHQILTICHNFKTDITVHHEQNIGVL